MHIFLDLRKVIKNQYGIRLNNDVRELLGEGDIIQTLKGRKMSWLGHTWRSNGIVKDAPNWKLQKKKYHWAGRQISGQMNPNRIAG